MDLRRPGGNGMELASSDAAPHAILMMAGRRHLADTFSRGGRLCPPESVDFAVQLYHKSAETFRVVESGATDRPDGLSYFESNGQDNGSRQPSLFLGRLTTRPFLAHVRQKR